MDKELIKNLSRTQKLTLMLLGLDNKPIKGQTWYQKEIFLISKLDKQTNNEVEFEAHHYGPHSYDVESALEDLESEGLVGELSDNKIVLTEEGKEYINEIKKEFSSECQKFIKEIKELLNDLSRMELLAYIYQTNKTMTTQSVELNNVKKKKVEYAISLFSKNKLSVAKAAEISELSLSQFILELKKKNIKIETGL